MKKILKRSLAILLCLTMIFNYSFTVLADENVESSEPETTYTETIETTESNEITETPKTTESIEESESEEESLVESSENIEEPEEIEEADISSPSEITDEENEENSIPEDMVEEPEEDELVADIEGVEELSLLGSIASPSEIEENEEVETEEEVEEATPSELEMPMLLGAPPLFGDPAPTDHCKIGSQGYRTLQSAIDAVTNGQTITMLQDVTYGTSLTINNGKTFTIDFNDGSTSHTFTWDVTLGPTINRNIFAIGGNSNVTVKNMKFLAGGSAIQGNRIFEVYSTGTLTLYQMESNDEYGKRNIPVLNNGGTVYIDGGNITTNSTNSGLISPNAPNPVVQNLGGTTTFKGNGTYTMQNSGTGAAWLGRVITQPAHSTDADRDSECGTVIIENGTFNTGQIVDVNGKGTITINDATYGTGNGPIIKAFHGGIKSNITINNITTSAMVFAQVIEELQTKINFQNGNVKYTPTRFCINQTGTAAMTSVSIKNGKFGPKTGSDDIHDEINNLLASGATLTALTGDPDGYTYKVETSTPTPPPTPIPPHGGGSSGGGGGGGGAGIPRYDLDGNILSPTGIQNYGYDGTNPPNLTGNITVSHWDYNIGNAQVADIYYVQNTDSFVRENNTPVVTDWVGISTNTNSKVLWYRTNANGQILRNQFIQIGNNIYYLDNNGIMVTGQYTINGKVYNFETTVGATEGRFLY